MAGIFRESSQTLSENESAISTEELRRNEEHITTDALLELQPTVTHVMRALDTPEDNDTDITASPDASPPDPTIAGFEGHECLQQQAGAVSIEREVSTCSIQVDSGVIKRDSGVVRIPEQYPEDGLWYDMPYENGARKVGKCVIFDFSGIAGHPERSGTKKDKERIRTLFGGQLGFDVDVHDNLRKEAMLKTLKKLAGEDHSSSYCLCLFLLSHAKNDDIICSDGQEIQLSKVYTMFEPGKCKGLAAKPKLFFVQACRGDDVDIGVRQDGPAHTDAWSFTKTLPSYADLFVFYATSPGLHAWRDENHGSSFIQTLCEVLEKNFHRMDFLTMMTRVTVQVGKKEIPTPYETAKQMPGLYSTLRKNLRFAGQIPSPKTGGDY
ncbi:caspase-3-like isoform X1 [Ornithodoros turicata]|uniref:caspase-3-like isoform X1 n=1 Tax=Ornithodoros turicata TaxID=34597 RepID=UPI0031394CB5